MAARDQPNGIEPTVGLAVIRQPVDVPMADEGRIGGIDGRAAADENKPVRKTRQYVSRPVGGMNLDDVAVLEGKVRYGGERAVTHDEHVTARQLEETLDIGDIFAAAIALPGQTAAEAELTAATDGMTARTSMTCMMTPATLLCLKRRVRRAHAQNGPTF